MTDNARGPNESGANETDDSTETYRFALDVTVDSATDYPRDMVADAVENGLETMFREVADATAGDHRLANAEPADQPHGVTDD